MNAVTFTHSKQILRIYRSLAALGNLPTQTGDDVQRIGPKSDKAEKLEPIDRRRQFRVIGFFAKFAICDNLLSSVKTSFGIKALNLSMTNTSKK